MSITNQQLISQVIARIPEWIRHELAVKDPAQRQRAEEALTAMIAAALLKDDTALPADPA